MRPHSSQSRFDSEVDDAPEHAEGHTPALVVAIDAGGLLIDAHDGADPGLQVAILETDAIANAEVIARVGRGGSLGLAAWGDGRLPAGISIAA